MSFVIPHCRDHEMDKGNASVFFHIKIYRCFYQGSEKGSEIN